jgi:hypothetical protein
VHLPGGRPATPMAGLVDEAANVCRWRELPAPPSHYGSRGAVLATILQPEPMVSTSGIGTGCGNSGPRPISKSMTTAGSARPARRRYHFFNTTRSRSNKEPPPLTTTTGKTHAPRRRPCSLPTRLANLFAAGAPTALHQLCRQSTALTPKPSKPSPHDPSNQPTASCNSH